MGKPGRKPLEPNKKRKNRNRGIPFTEDELKAAKKNAEKFGMNFNAFVRHAAINFCTENTKKRGQNLVISTPEVNRKTLMELSKIGNNLNQITKSINAKRMVFSEEVMEVLFQVKKQIEAVSKEINLK